MTVVYTVGYEGTDIERFIKTLRAVGINQVADVRAVPISRKKGFSKTKLRDHLEAAGITYKHFVALGDPKPGREAARAGRYDEFRAIYDAHLSGQAAQAELLEVQDYARLESTVLLCFERQPAECHRSIVANAISAETGAQIFHLYADEPEKYVRNAARLPVFVGCAMAAE